MFGGIRAYSQSLAASLMDTVVTITPRAPFAKDPGNPKGDDTLGYLAPFTTKGWYVSTQTKSFSPIGGANVAVEQDTIRLPVGTVVRSGDKLAFNGETWTAVDAGMDETWQAMVKVSVVKIGDG